MFVKIISGIGFNEEFKYNSSILYGNIEMEISIGGQVCEVVDKKPKGELDLPAEFEVYDSKKRKWKVNKAMVEEYYETKPKQKTEVVEINAPEIEKEEVFIEEHQKYDEEEIQEKKYKAPQKNTPKEFIAKIKEFIEKYKKSTGKSELNESDLELVYDKIEDLIFIFFR